MKAGFPSLESTSHVSALLGTLEQIGEAALSADSVSRVCQKLADAVVAETVFTGATISFYNFGKRLFEVEGFAGMSLPWIRDMLNNQMFINSDDVAATFSEKDEIMFIEDLEQCELPGTPTCKTGTRGLMMRSFSAKGKTRVLVTLHLDSCCDWNESERAWGRILCQHIELLVSGSVRLKTEKALVKDRDAALKRRLASDFLLLLDKAIPDDPDMIPTRLPLYPKERETLALLVEGCTNKEIAKRMGVSISTVKKHVHSLLAKIPAQNRAEAAAFGQRLLSLGGSARHLDDRVANRLD